jgi:hypothetical protein
MKCNDSQEMQGLRNELEQLKSQVADQVAALRARLHSSSLVPPDSVASPSAISVRSTAGLVEEDGYVRNELEQPKNQVSDQVAALRAQQHSSSLVPQNSVARPSAELEQLKNQVAGHIAQPHSSSLVPQNSVASLSAELEQLKNQNAALVAQLRSSLVPQNSVASPSAISVRSTAGLVEADGYVMPTLERSVGGVIMQPWDIDIAFTTFFRDMHPFLPFLTQSSPNSFYEREPFLFWTICVLGCRAVLPDLSKSLSDYVKNEAVQAPLRTCHNQAAATSVVQALLLLALWPFPCLSLLHEWSWIHCGSATHLALHVGLHQPLSASEFVPNSGRQHIPNLFCEFRRTWIAVYVVNNLISFARGYPSTVRADYNIIDYTLSSPDKLNVSPDLFKCLLIAQRIEEGQELGTSRTSQHGHTDPASREGIYRLLTSRLSETEKRISPLSPSVTMMLLAAQLQCQIQVLRSTSPVHLQETTILTAFDTAVHSVSLAREIQRTTSSTQLPMFLDALLLMSALLIFKIQISRFSTLIDGQVAQHNVAEAYSFCQETINDFKDTPARVSIFLNALYTLVAENQIPVGGFIIENTKCRGSQDILYEVSRKFQLKSIALPSSKAFNIQCYYAN